MSERTNDNLIVVNGLFDPGLAPEVLSEFSTLFRKPRQLAEALGQTSVLSSSSLTLLEGTAVGAVIDRVDTAATEHGYTVGAASTARPVQTFELADGRHYWQRTTRQVDGLALAIVGGTVGIEVGEHGAMLEPGDVAFVEGAGSEIPHGIAALPGSFATGLLIGMTERVPELVEAA